MYLRETVHLAKDKAAITNGTKDTDYQLTAVTCNKAGATPTTGQDIANYKTRIGLNYYWSDINAYQFKDLMDASVSYIWGAEIESQLRPDLGITGSTPVNPVYIPYSALVTGYVANLLVAGYAAGMSSFAWAEGRVIPNLCVLGEPMILPPPTPLIAGSTPLT